MQIGFPPIIGGVELPVARSFSQGCNPFLGGCKDLKGYIHDGALGDTGPQPIPNKWQDLLFRNELDQEGQLVVLRCEKTYRR